MKRMTMNFAATALFLAAVAPALAETSATHKIILPQDIVWKPAPAALPPGAEAAVLFGDPAKDGPFTLRVKVPKGYRIPPHTHPAPEVVTVISGTFRMGLGATAEAGKAQPATAGGFSAMPPGVVHYVFVDEDSILQINGIGPWGIDYVDPKDDPRKAGK